MSVILNGYEYSIEASYDAEGNAIPITESYELKAALALEEWIACEQKGE